MRELFKQKSLWTATLICLIGMRSPGREPSFQWNRIASKYWKFSDFLSKSIGYKAAVVFASSSGSLPHGSDLCKRVFQWIFKIISVQNRTFGIREEKDDPDLCRRFSCLLSCWNRAAIVVLFVSLSPGNYRKHLLEHGLGGSVFVASHFSGGRNDGRIGRCFRRFISKLLYGVWFAVCQFLPVDYLKGALF